jgi:PTH1 family peptidyl-tRNA hydrolase
MIAGLGNPGREYAGTRHNAGFDVLDRLAALESAPFRLTKEWKAEVATVSGVLLCKPLSYMNLSGEPVSAVAHYHRILPPEILIVLDDIALPAGKLRLRPSGSAGGHNGLQSVIDSLETEEVPRLRIGIGPPAGEATLTGHVLGRFTAAEAQAYGESLERALEAIDFARSNGVVAAMNKFN